MLKRGGILGDDMGLGEGEGEGPHCIRGDNMGLGEVEERLFCILRL